MLYTMLCCQYPVLPREQATLRGIAARLRLCAHAVMLCSARTDMFHRVTAHKGEGYRADRLVR